MRGYTDAIGNEQENYNLSVDRVASVLDYLEGKGIQRSRIKVMSYGEMRPVEDNETPEGRQKNRRVEIKVIELR